MPGLQFLDRAERSERRGHTNEREVMMDSFVVDVPAYVRMLEQRHELGSENQLAIYFRVKQWFLDHPIARKEQRLVALVPDRQGEHAPQIPGTISSPLVVSMNDGLGVAVGIKAMAAALEVLAEFAIVIDFAVVDNPGGAIGVVNRLLTALQIDDGQTAHGQAHAVT